MMTREEAVKIADNLYATINGYDIEAYTDYLFRQITGNYHSKSNVRQRENDKRRV